MPTHDDPTKAPLEDTVYTFAGWDPELAIVTGPATYKATFTASTREFKVTWKNYDGEVLEVDFVKYNSAPSYDGDVPKKPADAQYSYMFVGWTPELSPVVRDVEYTAKFDGIANLYTVTWYDEDGETILNQQSVPYGTMPEYHGEMPTKDATREYKYEFTGWTPEVVPVTGNANYVATFKAIYIEQPLTPEQRSVRMNRKFMVYFDDDPKATQGEPALVVQWGQASGVASYEVYAWYLDAPEPITPNVSTHYGGYAAYFTELDGEKIDFSRSVVVYVVAKNRRGEEVGRTVTAYVAGPDNADYANPATLTVTSGNSITLKVGETFDIQAAITLEDGSKDQIPGVPEFRYASSYSTIASVSDSGEITAVRRGTCVVQVYSKNALVGEIKVVVK
jgi:hypothetical protein